MIDKVFVLVLNYNCAEETCECVKSIIKKVKYPNYEIIILDNDSKDDSFDILSKRIPDIVKNSEVSARTLANATNYGYAHGNNKGIEIAIKEGADYVCILNPDTVAADDFISGLLKVMQSDKTIGMICPAGVKENNPDRCGGAGSRIGLITGYTKILNSGKRIEEIMPKLYECDYLGGMCILVRTELIKKIGMIPENYFLFYEETEWCTKCIKAGYKCVADADVKVIHKGSVTVDRASDDVFNMHNYYIYRNRIVFQKRNRPLGIYILFLAYYLAELTYCRIKGNYGREVWAAYIDGIFDKDRLHHIIGK